jgi:general secretion pathway protein A
MYSAYFGLTESPFAITPDPHYVFMSERHREAYAHLLYGMSEGGGFVQLTGEVGTGKTTLCRCVLEALPEHVDVAFILNPRLTAVELLATIGDELGVSYPRGTLSLKSLVDALHHYLLAAQDRARRTVLIIDEAQNLAPEVLEQIRLLTNLETSTQKLLQVILIGQPELIRLLDRQDLRQLAQRITARYHLLPLSFAETRAYIIHRLDVAGGHRRLFTPLALWEVYRHAKGVPRLINVICDRALLGAFVENRRQVNARTVGRAVREVAGRRTPWYLRPSVLIAALSVCAVGIGFGAYLGRDYFVSRTLIAEQERGASERTGSQNLAAPANTPTAPSAGDPNTPVDATPTPGAVPESGRVRILAPEQPALADLLDNTAVRGSKEAAFDALFELWDMMDVTAKAMGSHCKDAKSAGLRCVTKPGSWDDLRTFNRPAILELVNDRGNTGYAVLSALAGDHATLLFGSARYDFALAEIDKVWRGRYIRLRRALPAEHRDLKEGARGREVVWVRRRLAVLAGTEPRRDSSDVYDKELRVRVAKFQKSRGLPVTGIVNQVTLRRLSQAPDAVDDPVLQRPRRSQAMRASDSVRLDTN